MKNRYRNYHVHTLYKHVNTCMRVTSYLKKWIRFWLIVLDMKYLDGETSTTRLPRGSQFNKH